MAKTKQEKAPAAKQEKAPAADPVGEGLIRWTRPSGSTLDTNDAPGTVEYCEAQGWKRA